MKPRRLLAAAIAVVGCVASSPGPLKLFYPYKAANFSYGQGSEAGSEALSVFPPEGSAVKVNVPFHLGHVVFGPHGKSIYATNAVIQDGILREQTGLSKIEFNPIRSSPVAGTAAFHIKSFVVSLREDKVAISVNHQDRQGIPCGIFEILLPTGNVRQVLKSDCHDMWAWDKLSLSPDGTQAIATVGSNTDRDLHLELIDVVRGTTKPIHGDYWVGAWSPDGKWIAVLGNRNRDLSLIDPQDFSRRRSLGSTTSIMPAWSPDSRYLLLWKYRRFRCGFFLDIEPPGTLETLDIASGKRSAVQSSECRLDNGPTGWVSSEIAR